MEVIGYISWNGNIDTDCIRTRNEITKFTLEPGACCGFRSRRNGSVQNQNIFRRNGDDFMIIVIDLMIVLPITCHILVSLNKTSKSLGMTKCPYQIMDNNPKDCNITWAMHPKAGISVELISENIINWFVYYSPRK